MPGPTPASSFRWSNQVCDSFPSSSSLPPPSLCATPCSRRLLAQLTPEPLASTAASATSSHPPPAPPARRCSTFGRGTAPCAHAPYHRALGYSAFSDTERLCSRRVALDPPSSLLPCPRCCQTGCFRSHLRSRRRKTMKFTRCLERGRLARSWCVILVLTLHFGFLLPSLCSARHGTSRQTRSWSLSTARPPQQHPSPSPLPHPASSPQTRLPPATQRPPTVQPPVLPSLPLPMAVRRPPRIGRNPGARAPRQALSRPISAR